MENIVIFKRNKDFMKMNESEIDEMLYFLCFMKKVHLLYVTPANQKEQYKKELDGIDDMLFSCSVEKYWKVQIDHLKSKYRYDEIDKIKEMEYYPLSKERVDAIDHMVKELK